MIDLEERIGAALDTAADAITPQPLHPGRPRALARRRRCNRHIGLGVGALLVIVGFGAALRFAAASGTTIRTADENGLDVDGVPVDTGPELEWRRSGTNDLSLRDVVWSGERFVAIGGDDRGQLFTSPDGRDWEPLTDVHPDNLELGFQGVTAGDGRLVAWGPETTTDPSDVDLLEAPTRVVVSDDHGNTWLDLGPLTEGLPDDDPTDYVSQGDFVNAIAIAGDTVMALTSRQVWPNVAEVLLDRGLIGPEDRVMIESMETRYDTARVSATYCLNPDPGPYCDEDQNGGTEEISFVAPGIDGRRPEGGPTTVWTSTNSGPFEPVAVLEGETFNLVSAHGRFVTLSWMEGGRLLGSDDGQTWTPLGLDASPHHLAADDDTLVVASGVEGGIEYHRSADGGLTWITARLPTDSQSLAVGPGGHLLAGSVARKDPGPVGAFLNWVTGQGGDIPGIIGWSADGGSWGWQSQAEVFGSEGWPWIAVGDETAVALVWSHDEDGLGRSSKAVFVADIPE